MAHEYRTYQPGEDLQAVIKEVGAQGRIITLPENLTPLMRLMKFTDSQYPSSLAPSITRP